MKIRALEKEVADATEEQFTRNLLGAEAAKPWELYQSGVFREFYFPADTHEAVLVLECGGADEARSRLTELPLVKAALGLIDFKIAPEQTDGFRSNGPAKPEYGTFLRSPGVFNPKTL